MRIDRGLPGVALALGVTAAMVCPRLLAAQESIVPNDSIRAVLAERIRLGGAVGLVVGVVEGEAVRVVAAGERSTISAGPVDGTTVFEIGSVSKVLTATLLAEMVARGEVALDTPVRVLLPDSVAVPARGGREITLVDLATHSSGLPRLPGNLDPADPENPYADYDAGRLYGFLSQHVLRRDPGSAYEYSNLGLGLLGHALGRAAGRPYEELLIERILAPLGMHDTRIELLPDLQARLAQGHGADLEPVKGWDFQVLAGAGAWRSTAEEMLRFLASLLAPPQGRLGDALTAAMEPRRPAGGSRMQIGLGWHVLERDGRRITWHNGQTGGYHAFVGVDRGRRIGVVVLSNAGTDVDDVGLHLLDPTFPLRHPAPPRAEVTVPVEALDRYVGRYELAPEFVVEITREGEALWAQATGQQRLRLYAASPTRFFLRVVQAEVSFTEDASGAVTGLVLHQGGRDTPGRRMP